MIKRIVKGGLWLFLFLLLIILVTVAYLTSTNQGLKQLLSLGQKYAPGELNWKSADGSLLGPLNLEDFSYAQKDGLKVNLKSGSFDWSPSALLNANVSIDELAIDGLDISVPKPGEPEVTAETETVVLPEISLPVKLDLNKIDIRNIRLYPHEAEEPIHVEHIGLGAGAEGEEFQLLQLDIQTPEARVSANGTLAARQDYPMNIALDWAFQHPEAGEFRGKGTLVGTLSRLAIVHHLNGALSAKLDATVIDVLENPAWDARVKATSASLGRMVPAAGNIPLDARMTSRGNLDSFEATADVVSDTEQTGPVSVDLKLNGDIHKISIDQLLVSMLTGSGKIMLTGDIDVDKTAVDLAVDWKALGWPLVGAEQSVFSPNGQLSVQGTMDELDAIVSTAVEGDAFGQLNADIKTKLSGKQLTVSSLAVSSPESPVSINAGATFNLDSQQFDARGKWSGLDLPLQGEPAVKDSTGSFNASGTPDNYVFELASAIAGESIPSGDWKLTGAGSDKEIDQFNLTGNTLDGEIVISGNAGWTPEVSWDVVLESNNINPGSQWSDWSGKVNTLIHSNGKLQDSGPELVAIIKELTGALKDQKLAGNGEVQLSGETISVDDLNIALGETRITANGSVAENWDLDWRLNADDLSSIVDTVSGGITAQGAISGSAKKPNSTANFTVKKFRSGDTYLENVTGKASVSTDESVQSTLDLQGSQLEVAGQQWKSLSIQGSGTPQKHTLSIGLNGDLANVSTQLSGGLNEDTWNGALTKLSFLKTEFGDWTLESSTNLSANAEKANLEPLCLRSKPSRICVDGNWSAANGAAGKLNVEQLNATRFKKFLPETVEVDTSLSGTASGSLDTNNSIAAVAKFAFSEGTFSVNPDNSPETYTIVGGQLQANLKNDNLATQLDLDLDKLGTVNTETSIRNLSAKSTLSGVVKAQVNDLSLISAFAPQIQAVKGTLNTDLALSGNLDSPGVAGVIELADFSAEVPEYALMVTETRLTAKSDASGPLVLNGESKSGGGQLALNGKFQPETQSLELAVTGDNFQVANSSQIQARISPDINLSMDNAGMKVNGELLIPSAYINANGGNSEIQTVGGSSDVVIVEEESDTEAETAGSNLTIDLKIALGEDIRVEAGDFRGGLKGSLQIEQTPELAPLGTGTIEVVNGDYVIYGQQLNMQRGKILFGGGPVDNPQLDMDVARMVDAYDVVAGARIRGTAQAPQLQLYSEPSMPDASILSYILLGQPPGTTGGSYTVGKNLTPDLYVSYGIGLFNAINTFNMRYRLTDKLAVQAASSTASSADLIYTIEK